MPCAKVVSQFEVITAGDLGCHRAWMDAEKIRIVEESYRGRRQGSVVACRHGISRPLLTQWRRAYHKGLLDGGGPVFGPVEIGPDLSDRQRKASAMRTGDRAALARVIRVPARQMLSLIVENEPHCPLAHFRGKLLWPCS